MKKSQFYTTLASYYDFLCGDRKQDVKILETLIKKHSKSKGKNLLDVACGTGLEDFYLKKHFNVTGMDFHTGVLEIAKKRNPEVTYRKADMQHFNLKQKFDVIICFDAMIYLQTSQKFEKTLKNFHHHLKKGGVLIFYMDGTFLKECRKEKTTVIVEKKSNKILEVILFLIYKQKGAKIEGQDIFHITKNGKTEIHVEPPTQLGFFEVKKIKHTLQALGFKIHLYNLDSRTTFTTKEYSSNRKTPVFVCEKHVL